MATNENNKGSNFIVLLVIIMFIIAILASCVAVFVVSSPGARVDADTEPDLEQGININDSIQSD